MGRRSNERSIGKVNLCQELLVVSSSSDRALFFFTENRKEDDLFIPRTFIITLRCRGPVPPAPTTTRSLQKKTTAAPAVPSTRHQNVSFVVRHVLDHSLWSWSRQYLWPLFFCLSPSLFPPFPPVRRKLLDDSCGLTCPAWSLLHTLLFLEHLELLLG